jgi:hypothetical protein
MEKKGPYHIKGFQIDIAPRWSPAKKGDLRLARLPAILLRWMDIKYVFLHRVPPFFAWLLLMEQGKWTAICYVAPNSRTLCE